MSKDLTVSRPFNILLTFSTPMLIGNLFQQLYNLVDLIVVGNFIGDSAVAAVGTGSLFIFFLGSFIIGLTNGISVIVSQYFGRGDYDNVRNTFGNSIYVLTGIGLIITVISLILAKPLLILLNTPETVFKDAHTYLVIVFSGFLGLTWYNGISSVLRAIGNTLVPLIFLIIATILNLVLDLFFIINLDMGIEGVAIATVISQSTSAILCIVYVILRVDLIKPKKSNLRFNKEIVLNSLKIGIPSSFQNSFIGLGGLIVQKTVNGFGESVSAGYAAAQKIDQIAVQPFLSLGMAIANYTGQNVGAGKFDRVKEGLKATLIMVLVFCLVWSTVIFLFNDNLVRIFLEADSLAIVPAKEYLKIVSIFYPILGLTILLQSLLRGAGDVKIPLISSIGELVLRAFAAMVLSKTVLGYLGIWFAGPSAWIISSIICYVRFHKGKWKNNNLMG